MRLERLPAVFYQRRHAGDYGEAAPQMALVSLRLEASPCDLLRFSIFRVNNGGGGFVRGALRDLGGPGGRPRYLSGAPVSPPFYSNNFQP